MIYQNNKQTYYEVVQKIEKMKNKWKKNQHFPKYHYLLIPPKKSYQNDDRFQSAYQRDH